MCSTCGCGKKADTFEERIRLNMPRSPTKYSKETNIDSQRDDVGYQIEAIEDDKYTFGNLSQNQKDKLKALRKEMKRLEKVIISHYPNAFNAETFEAPKRQRIGNRFISRRKDGTISKNVDVGRSLSADRRRKAKTTASAGQGDKGDLKRAESKFDKLSRELLTPFFTGEGKTL